MKKRHTVAGTVRAPLRRKQRHGAAVVEFAILAPLLMFLIFGMVEYGRMVMVQQMLTNGSREGARVAILEGSTDDEVKDAVLDKLNTTIPTLAAEDITVDPSTASATPGQSMTVTVSIPFSEVSWLPTNLMKYVGVQEGFTLSASSSMRRESLQ